MTDFIHPAAKKEALRLILEAKESKATELDLSRLNLSELPGEIIQIVEHLTTLNLSSCVNLKSISGIGKLQNLQHLSLTDITNISGVEELSDLTSLTNLDIDHLFDFNVSGTLIKKLTNLQQLSLGYCRSLECLSPLSHLVNLVSLKIIDSQSLVSLKGIEKLQRLEHLEILRCRKLRNTDTVKFPAGLRTLDLNPLRLSNNITKLTELQRLHIVDEGLIDLEGLHPLKNLRSLNIKSNSSLVNLSGIEKLPHLTKLVLTSLHSNFNLDLPSLRELEFNDCASLETLGTIGRLRQLQKLSIRNCANLAALEGISHLTNLTHLNIETSQNLVNIEALSKLNQLTELEIQNCPSVNNLQTIEQLTELNALNCKFNSNFRDQESVELDLTNLNKLVQLDTDLKINNLPNEKLEAIFLHRHSDINELSRLTNLKHLSLCTSDSTIDFSSISNLDLTSIHITDSPNLTKLNGLELFPQLNGLIVTGENKLKELNGLDKLTKLKSLILFGSRYRTKIPWEATRALLLDRAYLAIYGELDCEKVPPELTSPFSFTLCHDWLNEIDNHGHSEPKSLKVMLLGNGRIGKTQLARGLRGESFDPKIPSTHGIQLHRFQDLKSRIDLQTWDFGGQDVYLGTHSLFIDNRALYLLLWTPNSENNDVVRCEKLIVKNRPLSYWLSYLKSLAGEDANVLVCQSQCDDPKDDQSAPIPHPSPITNSRQLAISTKIDGGLDIFYPSFYRAIEQQRKQNGITWLPKSWLAVENELLSMVGITTLQFDDFEKLCREHRVSAPSTLATYLHQAGKVFYRHGCFSNRIILDQSWALQGVYLLLEREDALPNLVQMGGKFTIETIERLLWKEQGRDEDKHLFIEMMTQCGVCFPITKHHYLAPDALPPKHSKSAEIEQIWQGAEPDYHVKLSYDFLHDATMRFLLCKIGEKAQEAACYWRYGCCYYDSKYKSKVLFECNLFTESERQDLCTDGNFGQPGYIDIKVQGPSNELIAHLVESIVETNHLDSKANVNWLTGNPVKIKGHKHSMPQTENTPFDSLGEASPVPSNKSPVYFTYAWGNDDKDPKQVVSDDIFNLLNKEHDIEVFRDKDSMGLGDSIEEFEHKIGRSAFVLMIISKKYLYESTHCMNELRLIHEHSQQQHDSFISRVIPVIMSDAKIDNLIDRLKVVKHWKDQKTELDGLIAEVGSEAAGSETVKQQAMMTSFINSIGNTLHWLSDLVIDRTENLQAETAVELVKKRIAQSKE
ncbi:COR domain-containing protein [Vibrio chagasii]|uniref:COR domain-containing protein n=1 Tax=Vibrio chagasii TaxID=170679 RepID=UPI00397F1DB6